MTVHVGSHSPDGAWWWSGSQWLPAVSPDGSWWFDGSSWQARPGSVRPAQRSNQPVAASRAELVIAALWLVAWALALGWAVHLSALDPGTSTASRWLTVGVGLGLATVTGVVGTSTWLAARARWVQQLVFAVFVVVLSTAWYVAAMLLLSPPGPEGDTGDVAAGAGLVVLLLPTVLLVALLAGVGSGLGLVIARLRH